VKVTGVYRDDGGKDYLISHNGKQHKATKSGSLFSCNGVTDTLRNIKKMIQGGELVTSQPPINAIVGAIQIHDETNEIREKFSDIRKRIQEDKPSSDVGLWDCVNPCALIVKIMVECHTEFMPQGLEAEIDRTLDAHGYLLPDGSYDTEQANREYQTNMEILK
jgi:hypothetical protein